MPNVWKLSTSAVAVQMFVGFGRVLAPSQGGGGGGYSHLVDSVSEMAMDLWFQN